MKVLRRFLFLPVLLVTAVNLVGAPITELQQRSRTSEPKRGEDRLQILQREFPKFADSALAMQNVGLKIWTLSSLADLLWAIDPASARALFQKTYDLLKGIAPTENAKSVETGKLPQGKLVTLYVLFFSFVGKHDPAWKEQLISEAPEFVRNPTLARNLDVATANLLLKEKNSGASDFIEAVVSGGVSGFTHSMQVLDMLSKLRRLDGARADRLFLRVMDQLVSQGSTSTDDLFTIGNYLFTRSSAASGIDEEMVLVSPVYVGTISFHADISVDRPEISADLVEQYLRSSVAVLTRPVTNEITFSEYRAAAFLLLPKARRYAPQYVPLLTTLSAGIDPRRTNSAEARASSSEQTPLTDVGAMLEHLDTIKTSVQRDEYCLRMIWSFYAKNDFQSARTLNERMSSLETRSRIFDVIFLRQAINSLQAGDVDSARQEARKLPQDERRAFLWLTIGAGLIERRNFSSARAAIESGLACWALEARQP